MVGAGTPRLEHLGLAGCQALHGVSGPLQVVSFCGLASRLASGLQRQVSQERLTEATVSQFMQITSTMFCFFEAITKAGAQVQGERA